MSEEERGYLKAQTVKINYNTARFHRRVLANLVDFALCALFFFSFFIGIRGIVTNIDPYKAREAELISIRLNSGMYMQYNDSGNLTDTVSFLSDSYNAYSGIAKVDIAKEKIDTFILYLETNVNAEAADKVRDSYHTFFLSDKMVYEGVPMFIDNAGKIERNKDCKASADVRFSKAYAPFIDEYCQGYLITLVPQYLDLVRFESNVLIYGEILPAYLIAPLLAYLLPMMVFKRGRQTFGKWMYRIGTVNKDLLIPSVPRTLARFAILYFAEYCLAPFTFAIPFLVSASLMGFSKKHQGLPDYILGLHEVDLSQAKIYFSREEIAVESVSGAKKAPDFEVIYDD